MNVVVSEWNICEQTDVCSINLLDYHPVYGMPASLFSFMKREYIEYTCLQSINLKPRTFHWPQFIFYFFI